MGNGNFFVQSDVEFVERWGGNVGILVVVLYRKFASCEFLSEMM